MKYIIKDPKYHFLSAFDTETGACIRTGVLDSRGRDTGKDPFMASFPHLIDVGVMGHCIHGKTGLCSKAGIGCYQNGQTAFQPNMSAEAFRTIARECSGRCNQFALGGRGDPDQHEEFETLLKICREYTLVPNFTTSGLGMTPDIAALCKAYCGAVAVSWYRSDYTHKAIQMLLDAGVKTNIHYVLGNNSIDEAIIRLEQNDFPAGINAVIFLLHKPVGQGKTENVLQADDPRVQQFFHLLEKPHPFKTGLDSCSAPGVLNFCTRVLPESIDTCEGARFSCYIGPDLMMTPCSFDQKQNYTVSLQNSSIEEVWNSKPFWNFRRKMQYACPSCKEREACMGGCPLEESVVLCMAKVKNEKP